MSKVPNPKELAERARRNLSRERERLRRRGVAEDALECLLRRTGTCNPAVAGSAFLADLQAINPHRRKS